MRTLRTLGIAFLVFAVVLCAAAVVAAAEDSLGFFKDWSAISYQDDSDKVCVAWSAPQRQSGDYAHRGDPFVFISRRQSTPRHQVRFTPGYRYQDESRVMVTIKTYSIWLETDGKVAWSEDKHNTSRLIRWMLDGAEMTVEGVSSRGTKTRDVYSLQGVSAAYKAINKGCG